MRTDCSNFLSLLYVVSLLFFITKPVQSHTLTGNILKDLQSTDQAGLNLEAANWTITSIINTSIKTSVCDTVPILGGYEITNSGPTFKTTYTNLPSHNQINFSFQAFLLDSWDVNDNDHFEVMFDSTNVVGWTIIRTAGPLFIYDRCGNGVYLDYPPTMVHITVPHTSSTLTLMIKAVLNEPSSNESFGFRDITMEFIYSDYPVLTMCGISPASLPDRPCPCSAPNQYMDPVLSGTCEYCHPTCETCFNSSTNCLTCIPGTYFVNNQCLGCDLSCKTCSGGGANQCTSCITGYYMNYEDNSCHPGCLLPLVPHHSGGIDYCDTNCPGQYVYWDQTCSTTCPYPLIPTTSNGFDLCVYPCNVSDYLLWNGTCVNPCPYSSNITIINSRNLCNFPCAPGEYYYWDGSCQIACDFPLVKSFHGGLMERVHCEYPCQSAQFLYFNGSCLNTCPSPLSVQPIHGKQFCNYHCSMTEYLYWNGTCRDSCLFPLSIRVESFRSYCDYPCTNTLESLFWNGTCELCNPPLTLRNEAGKKYCDFGCPIDKYLYWDKSCQTFCDFPLIEFSEGDYELRYFCKYPCQISDYLYWNGTCNSSCPYPFTNTTSNSRNFCHFPCPPNKYLYWNSSCLDTCDFPHSIRLEGNITRSFCDYPCTNNSDFLFWNGTCGSCTLPFGGTTKAGKNYCEFPCNTNEYLYWDGSCNTTCVAPMVEGVEGYPMLRYFCNYPCEASQYLYWNGTCSYECNYPLFQRTETNSHFCDYPCSTNQHLYYNQSCLLSCDSPLVLRIEASLNYCDYPCSDSQYLAWNGSCFDSCSSPLVNRTYSAKNFCYPPCPNPLHYYMQDNFTCNETCNYPYIEDYQKPYPRCFPPAPLDIKEGLLEAQTNPGQVTIVVISKLMQYMKYLDTYMPVRLQRLTSSRGRNVLSTFSGIQLPDKTQENFAKENTPIIYARTNLHSSFLVNYWDNFMTILIGIAIAIVLTILEKLCHKFQYEIPELIFQRLRVIARWNYVLMFFASNIDEIILYSALEFKTINSASRAAETAPLSFMFCAMSLGLMVGLIYFIYFVIKQQLQTKSDEEMSLSHDSNKKWEDFQIFYRGFKTNNIFKRSFFLVYMMRIGLPMFIAVCAENSPLLICVLQIVISFLIIGFLLTMNPFTKKVNLVQLVLIEVIVLLMNICVTLLTLYNEGNVSHPRKVPTLVDFIYIGNDIINILVLVFLVTKVGLEGFAIHKNIQKQGIKGIKRYIAFLQLLALPLQQGNMGFEEVITYNPFNTKIKENSVMPIQEDTSRRKILRNQETIGENSFGTTYNERDITQKVGILEDEVTTNSMRIHKPHVVETDTFIETKVIQEDLSYPPLEGMFGGKISNYKRFQWNPDNDRTSITLQNSSEKPSIMRLRDKMQERKNLTAQINSKQDQGLNEPDSEF